MHSTLTADRPLETSKILTGGIHGVLNIRKPVGWTSHDVVQRLRRLLGIRKVGHAGTLDPTATGVLPVLLGKGTKIANYLLEWEKEYTAILRLGQSTDTQDASGTVIQEIAPDTLSEEHIRSVVKEFQGEIQQIPPMYSAVKVNGQPLYKAARRGETLKRSPRKVIIYRIELLAVRERDVDLQIHCSKGTYIRTLCADIGERLQVGGHLLWLERSRVGPFQVQAALDIENLTDSCMASVSGRSFLTIDDALSQLPVLVVKTEHVKRVLNGVPIPWQEISAIQDGLESCPIDGQRVRMRDPKGQLLAIGKISSSSQSTGGYEMKDVRVETMCVER